MKIIKSSLPIEQQWIHCFDILFQLSLTPFHRLNILWFAQEILSKNQTVGRDCNLSYFLNKSFENHETVFKILDVLTFTDRKKWHPETRKLSLYLMSIFCTCTDRRIRDRAGKILMMGFCESPETMIGIFDFANLYNDEYLYESIFLSVYSSMLISKSDLCLYSEFIETILHREIHTTNKFIRDNIFLIIKQLDYAGKNSLKIDFNKSSLFSRKEISKWPDKKDIDDYLKVDLPSNMKLMWDIGFGSDFWRYIVEPALRIYDLKSQGITKENIASWMIQSLCKMGYLDQGKCALDADRYFQSQYGFGRSRPAYIETIGKKFLWISFHRLMGVLEDNCEYSEDSYGFDMKMDFTPRIRQADFTDIRDMIISSNTEIVSLKDSIYAFPEKLDEEWCKVNDFPEIANIIYKYDNECFIPLTVYYNSMFEKDNYSYANYSYYLYSGVFKNIRAIKQFIESPRLSNEFSNPRCYRLYIAEYPYSYAFQKMPQSGYLDLENDDFTYTAIELLRGGDWEYDFSYIGDSQNHIVPFSELLEFADLKWDQHHSWINSSHRKDIIFSADEVSKKLLVRQSLLDQFLKTTKKALFFARFVYKCVSYDNHQDSHIFRKWDYYIYSKGHFVLCKDTLPY